MEATINMITEHNYLMKFSAWTDNDHMHVFFKSKMERYKEKLLVGYR